MRGAPKIALFCGILSAVAGAALLAASGQLPVLAWYAIPVILLSLALIIMCFRARKRPVPELPIDPASVDLPGPWYPHAILGIFTVLLVWIIYWTKMR